LLREREEKQDFEVKFYSRSPYVLGQSGQRYPDWSEISDGSGLKSRLGHAEAGVVDPNHIAFHSLIATSTQIKALDPYL
jgi:hypothetical protein